MDSGNTPPPSPPLQNSSSPRDQEPDDIENLLKWAEARRVRKLRGEYESAVLHLSELINNNLSTPLRINSVRVEGAENTRKSFIGFLVKPLVPAAEGSNVEAVLHATRRISEVLQQADIFGSVDTRLERARDVLSSPRDVDVVVRAKEKGRFFVKSATEFGNNEGSASITARVRNVFGGAEMFEANVSTGTTTRQSYHGTLSAPITPDLGTRVELAVFAMQRDNTSFASCWESLQGLKAILRNGSPTTGIHELAYEGVLRNIGGLTPTASMCIRQAAGTTSKSSVSYAYTLDTRDDRISASQGVYAKLYQEVAGLGGDASFYKAEADTQVSRSLLSGVSASFALRSGLMFGISRPTIFSDRFQLGGPMSVRAFKPNGLGPRDGQDSLGGDMYWSAGVSVVSNLPLKPDWPLKTHAWINAGRLDNMDKSRSVMENVKDAITRPSISAGVGLIYRFDPVRVEVNFGLPLVANKSDGLRRGIQVGIGLEFL
ncbi:surface antigen-domain-containing protein [Armillaria luteobubalina]|uniref:Surface antigen-domain-containing protein n=1 Tax=Armillaria luteobubalina TaxID=153913 RepID=A0AA39Q0Y7_9AGAR|nr:surface antigen-domain-containing protein [Armillaria luteobubalina]